MLFGIYPKKYEEASMSDSRENISYVYDKSSAKEVSEWLGKHSNFILVSDILKQEHLRNRDTFTYEKLLKKGFSEKFLVNYLGDHNEPAATFIIILCDNARQYGFPANAAIIGLAMENGLVDNRIESAMTKLMVPTSV